MAEQYKAPYLDSCVFIDWLQGEYAEGDRGKIAKNVIEMAEQGKYEIFTSALSIAEVTKKKVSQNPNDRKPMLTDKELLFFDHKYIKLIIVDREIARKANRLSRDHNLGDRDAIHLASALRYSCDVLLTQDSDLLDLTNPGIRIERPALIGQMQLDFGAPGKEGSNGDRPTRSEERHEIRGNTEEITAGEEERN